MHFAKTLVASLLIAAGAAQAAPVNTGFESNSLTGWTTYLVSGQAQVVSSHTTNYGGTITYTPVEGQYFLAIASGTVNVWQTASQSFTLQAGDQLSGMAAFNWGDYNPYFDGVMVEILDAAGGVAALPFSMDGNGKASGFNGSWTAWNFTAASAGTYTVVYGARNTGDSGGPEQTYGYFDATKVTAKVPEPMTLGLVGLGLLGAGIARRRATKA